MAKKNKEEKKSAFDVLKKAEKEFFLAYLKLGNATKAYMYVHPKVNYNTAGVEGHKRLKKPRIKAALKEHYDNLWANKEDKIAELFEDILKMSKADINDVVEYDDSGYMKIKKFDEIDTSIIQSVTQHVTNGPNGENVNNSIKIVDKQKAQSDLLRVLGMIKDKIDVEGTITVVPPIKPESEENEKS